MNDRAVRLASASTAVLLAVASFAFAPSPAVVSSASTADLGPSAVGVAVVKGESFTTIEGLRDRLGTMPGERRDDLAAWMRQDRRIVQAADVATFSAVDTCLDDLLLVQDECDEEPIDGEPWDETYSFSYVASLADVDGDGFDDIAEVRDAWDGEEYSQTLTVRSGHDAGELWTLDGDAFGFFGVTPDVDGDGGADLISFAYGMSDWGAGDSCTLVRCTYSEDYSEGMTISLLSGGSGELLLTRELAFSYGGQDTLTSVDDAGIGVYEGSYAVTDDFAALGFADVDGDGTSQLAISALSFEAEGTEAFALFMDEETYSYDDVFAGRYASSLDVTTVLIDPVSGAETVVADTQRDGDVAFPGVIDMGSREALVLDRFDSPSFDVVGGCLFSDTLSTYECGDSSDLPTGSSGAWTRQLLDADLTPAWTVDLDPSSWYAYGAGGDVNGDGVADLLDARWDEESGEDMTGVISGADGSLLDTLPVTGGAAADGGLVTVSFTFEYEYDQDTEAYSGTIRASSARYEVGDPTPTASAFLAEETYFDDGERLRDAFIGIWLTPVAGDGVDVLTVVEAFELELVDVYEECWEYEDPDTGEMYEECWEERWYDVVDQSTTVTAHDGADLALLGGAALGTAYLDAVADMDDDGVLDVISTEETATEDEDGWWDYAYVTSARRLDGSVIWTHADDAEYLVGLLGTPDGTDLLSQAFDTNEALVRDGATLAVRLRFAL